MRIRMPRSRLSQLWGLMALLVPLLFVTTPVSTISAQEAVPVLISAGTTYTVLAGFDDIDAEGMAIEAFLPQDIFINEGDTVPWTFSPLESHNVMFLSGADRPEELLTCPPKTGPGVMLGLDHKEGDIWQGTDTRRNR